MIPYMLYMRHQVDRILRPSTHRDLDVVLGCLPGKLSDPSLTGVLGFQMIPGTTDSPTTTSHNYPRSASGPNTKLLLQLSNVHQE